MVLAHSRLGTALGVAAGTPWLRGLIGSLSGPCRYRPCFSQMHFPRKMLPWRRKPMRHIRWARRRSYSGSAALALGHYARCDTRTPVRTGHCNGCRHGYEHRAGFFRSHMRVFALATTLSALPNAFLLVPGLRGKGIWRAPIMAGLLLCCGAVAASSLAGAGAFWGAKLPSGLTNDNGRKVWRLPGPVGGGLGHFCCVVDSA